MSTSTLETTISDPQPLVWTRDVYGRAAEAGVFGDLRVELVEGEIIKMNPANSRHANTVYRVAEMLRIAFGSDYLIRSQSPVSILETSQPEPDVAVVSGDIDDYDDHHPDTTLLIVEVADTTIRYDRVRKARIYSKAKLSEYWIVNLNSEQLEVFRQPDGAGEYAEKFVMKRGDRISPLAAPGAVIEVAKLLPKPKSTLGP